MSASAPLLNDASASASPSKRIWHRTYFQFGRTLSSFPALLLALLIGKVLYICADRIADPDLWWHLRDAQFLFSNHRFPNVDIFSFTAAGSPWINHEWLSEVFYYSAFHAFGLNGIFLLTSVVLATITVAVFWMCLWETRDPFAAAIATFSGCVLATVGFGPRTQHFGWLCFVGIYIILLRFRSTKRAPLWFVPVLFAVWINCHGGWLIGFLIYGIFVGSGLVHRDVGRLIAHPWSTAELKKLIVIGIVSIGVLFLNPFGYRLILYPFDMIFRQRLNTGNVEEWASVNFNNSLGILVVITLGGVFAAALISKRRWRIDDALLTAFVVYSGVSHIRFLLLAGIVLPPILAGHLGKISAYDPRRERQLLNSVLLTLVAAGCILGYPSKKKLELEQSELFPIRAVKFLGNHPQPGHMFNFYNWGGYLDWALPHTPTFIDGRADIFEYNGTLKDYLSVSGLIQSQEILDRYKVSYIIYPNATPLAYFLSRSSQWERIYEDPQAVIYRRVKSPHRLGAGGTKPS